MLPYYGRRRARARVLFRCGGLVVSPAQFALAALVAVEAAGFLAAFLLVPR